MKPKAPTKATSKSPKPKSFVTIQRHRDLEALHGAFLRESPKWVLIQNIEDFRIDGYSLIHKIQIKGIRQSKGDRFYQGILEKEGIAAKVKDLPKLDIGDFAATLEFIKASEAPVIIECELMGAWPFSIGYIGDIGENDFELRYFDSEGGFEKKPRTILFAHVDRVGIQERYGLVFGKYLKKPGKRGQAMRREREK